MSATRPSFAAQALGRFPAPLVQMIRAGASMRQVRDEGFTPDEIAAVAELVLLADSTEHLDGGNQAARDTRETPGPVDETTLVTGSPG